MTAAAVILILLKIPVQMIKAQAAVQAVRVQAMTRISPASTAAPTQKAAQELKTVRKAMFLKLLR